MAQVGSDYRDLSEIFNTRKGRGVFFPYFVGNPFAKRDTNLLVGTGPISGFDLDSSDDYVFWLPFKSRLVTAYAVGISDSLNMKAATASTEPVLAITYGASSGATFNSAGDGTEISTCTINGTLAYGHRKNFSTTETEIEAWAPIAVYVKTIAVSATSANADGGATVVMWFAQMDGIPD